MAELTTLAFSVVSCSGHAIVIEVVPDIVTR